MINACDGSGALEDNRLVHEQLIQSGYQFDFFVCNSLVDMYAKCGSIWNVSKGRRQENVSTQMSLWGVVWWTCMQNLGAWKMLGECSTRISMNSSSSMNNLLSLE